VVQVACQVCAAKSMHKCGGVRSMRGELHRALKDTGHSGLCEHPWDTKLYKSGCGGWEHVGFTLLRPRVSAARLGIQGKSYTEL
jgi:hypothetical protein